MYFLVPLINFVCGPLLHRKWHTGPERYRIVHKLVLYLSEPDWARLGPPRMIFNQELISKAFHKYQENCQILVNSWVLKLT